MPCPATGCSNSVPTNFTHTPGCGSRLEVSSRARIRCGGCSFACDLKDYHFACSNHRGDYRSIGRDSLDKSLSIVLGMGSVNQVMTDLSVYIVNHR